MDKKELQQYIIDHLRIELNYNDLNNRLVVQLKLINPNNVKDTIISEDYIYNFRKD